jgi:proton glutamate symport protein
VGSLVALAAGFVVGIFVHRSGDPALVRVVDAVGVIGQLWVAALRMTVIPLVIALTLVAIVGARRERSIGALGARAFVLFLTMLVGVSCLTLAVARPVLASHTVDSVAAASFRAQMSEPLPSVSGPTPAASVTDWLLALVPSNVFSAAVRGEILPILLFTGLFGLAVRRLPRTDHELLRSVFEGFSGAMMAFVGFVLKVMPLGVFALCAVFASRLGSRATGVIVFYIVLVSGILLLATLLLYPLTAVLARTSLAKFARAVAPAQVVAVSTRSSLASLPAMVEGGRKHLALPESATGFVLPLCVATFKLDYGISSLVRLLFVAHVLDIRIGAPEIAAFLLTQFLLSFSAAGIPGAGSVRSLPAFLVAGVPIEGVLILNAVDAIPDIFATLANVTADMSASTILTRKDRVHAAAESVSAVG